MAAALRRISPSRACLFHPRSCHRNGASAHGHGGRGRYDRTLQHGRWIASTPRARTSTDPTRSTQTPATRAPSLPATCALAPAASARMLSKKPALLLSSYASLSPLCHSSHAPSAPPARKSCRHTFAPRRAARQNRSYAQHADAPLHRHDPELLQWPDAVKPHRTPTPYQILKCSRGEQYTKQRFYALVKLYHPDRCHKASPVADLPLHIRLERYRLLVTAHDILSDIEKRKAYDAWGHGWAGHHHTPPQRPTSGSSTASAGTPTRATTPPGRTGSAGAMTTRAGHSLTPARYRCPTSPSCHSSSPSSASAVSSRAPASPPSTTRSLSAGHRSTAKPAQP
jgi:hypothetical protein